MMDTQALWLSLTLATITTFLLGVMGLPLAYWLAMSRWRWKFLIEAVVALPLVLPPTVLGFYLLVATGPRSLIGRGINQLFGTQLPFTFPGIVLGSILFNLPFAVRPFIAVFSGLDRRLLEASWCLGETGWGTFRRVTLPLCWPGILAGLILTFAHSMGEFGVVLMLGGNIPGVTRTLSISIYEDVQALNYAAAHQASLVLLIVSFGVISLAQCLTRRWAPT